MVLIGGSAPPERYPLLPMQWPGKTSRLWISHVVAACRLQSCSECITNHAVYMCQSRREHNVLMRCRRCALANFSAVHDGFGGYRKCIHGVSLSEVAGVASSGLHDNPVSLHRPQHLASIESYTTSLPAWILKCLLHNQRISIVDLRIRVRLYMASAQSQSASILASWSNSSFVSVVRSPFQFRSAAWCSYIAAHIHISSA